MSYTMNLDLSEMGFLTFRYETASAYLDFLADDMSILNSVRSEMRGVGDGTGLMKAVCAYADENCMSVLLYVGAEDIDDIEMGRPLTDEELVKWYEKFGFKLQYTQPEMHPQMLRHPAREKVRPIEERD